LTTHARGGRVLTPIILLQLPEKEHSMKILHYRDVTAENVEEGAKGVRIRWIITEATGAKNFVMRHFEVDPGGYTPRHTHAWEHEVFVLEGQGAVKGECDERSFSKGDAIFVPAGELHQFCNTGASVLQLLCLIPSREKCSL
jgi:quercetin dioxygenase-like cupin family protein